jgi:DNA-directed RNA polymerase subunit RPC12/RpoP
MQPFVCPECGRHSSFDPWASPVRCPECGYTPAADESVPKQSSRENKRSLRCRSCGRDLTGLRAPFHMVPRCPYCNSTNLCYALTNSPPKRVLLKGTLLGVLVLVSVQLLLSWLDHSETLCPSPLIGVTAALVVWIWYVRRNRPPPI